MITRLKNRLSRFRSEESGETYTLEFVVMFPLILATFAFGVELTTHANRQFQLDHGLEVTTRAIRLNTSTQYSHDDLKAGICEFSGGLDDCENRLRLEMTPVNPRDFTSLPNMPDCTNAPQPVTPVRGWSLGQQHELMLLRACYKFDTVFGFGLGSLLGNDAGGRGTMVSMSAFVQEPR